MLSGLSPHTPSVLGILVAPRAVILKESSAAARDTGSSLTSTEVEFGAGRKAASLCRKRRQLIPWPVDVRPDTTQRPSAPPNAVEMVPRAGLEPTT